MIDKTKVGKRLIEVRRHHFPTVVSFSAGEHGKRERGDFCFWTAVLKEPRKLRGRTSRKIWGRAHVTLPPGDRFDRMKVERKKSRAAEFYQSAWCEVLQEGENIAYIRPTTKHELDIWLKTHSKDAPYVYRASVGGKLVIG